jgi:hypothetical protein
MSKRIFALLPILLAAATFADVQLVFDSPERTIFRVEIDEYPSQPNGFGPRNIDGISLCGRMFRVAVPKSSRIDVSLRNIEWGEWSGEPVISTEWRNLSVGSSVEYIRTATIRGVEIAGIDYIPDRYDPNNGLRRMVSAEIVVEHRGFGNASQPERLYHPTFARLFRAILVNPEAALPTKAAFAVEEWDTSDGAELLVITYPPFEDELQPWIDWKILMGMPTIVVSTSVTGMLKTEIKNYIQTAYDTWDIPPAFVLFVGDPDDDQVPTWGEWEDPCIGDNEFGCVDGTDQYPDVLPGRFACDTEAQVQLFCEKHLNYEMRPDTTDDWTLRSVGVVREEDCPFDPHGSTDSSYIASVNYMLDRCDSAGFVSTEIFTKCSGDHAIDAQTYIETGCNFISYRGQGMRDWWDPFEGLQQLYAGGRCPVIVSITCGMGDFRSSDGRPCETSTRYGSIAFPSGSVAYMGQAALSSNSLERSSLAKHIFEGFFSEKLNELAAAHTYGKIEMLAEFGVTSSADYEYTTATLVGSPEMATWTAPFKILDLTYMPGVPVGTADFEFEIFSSGSPVEGARVTIHTGESFSYSITDSTGRATLSFFIEPLDTPVLVVTGHNFHPFIDTLTIVASGAAILPAPSIFTEIVGNGDSLLNPGETVRIAPMIFNIGTDSVDGLSGLFRYPAGITPIDSISAFPSLGTWDTVAGDDLEFVISPDFPATEDLPLKLYVAGHPDGPWELDLIPSVGVHRFKTSLIEVTIFDEPIFGGDDDGRLDPGETAELEIRFANLTLATASNIEATLESSSDIFVIQEDAEYFDLEAGDTVAFSPRFTISSAPFAIGDYTLDLIMTGDCGTYTYLDTLEVLLSISGTPSFTDPWLLPVGEILVDDSLGDGDGVIEPCEAISIFVDITNAGTAHAPNVKAFTAMTPFVFPIDSGGFGDIVVGDTIANTTAIVCSTASYTPSDTTLFVPIRVVSGGYSTTVVARIVIGDGSAIGEVSSPLLKPDEISISAYPNPFNSAVNISVGAIPYGLLGSHELPLQIEIFDISGRRVAEIPGGGTVGETLVASSYDEKREGISPSPTIYEYVWMPDENIGSGVYLVRAKICGNKGLQPLVAKLVVYLK